MPLFLLLALSSLNGAVPIGNGSTPQPPHGDKSTLTGMDKQKRIQMPMSMPAFQMVEITNGTLNVTNYKVIVEQLFSSNYLLPLMMGGSRGYSTAEGVAKKVIEDAMHTMANTVEDFMENVVLLVSRYFQTNYGLHKGNTADVLSKVSISKCNY